MKITGHQNKPNNNFSPNRDEQEVFNVKASTGANSMNRVYGLPAPKILAQRERRKVAAQHGPVKILWKDGKPVDQQ